MVTCLLIKHVSRFRNIKIPLLFERFYTLRCALPTSDEANDHIYGKHFERDAAVPILYIRSHPPPPGGVHAVHFQIPNKEALTASVWCNESHRRRILPYIVEAMAAELLPQLDILPFDHCASTPSLS